MTSRGRNRVSDMLRKASFLIPQPLLTIFDLEPLDLQIVAVPVSQVILAEPKHLEVIWGYLGIVSFINLHYLCGFYQIT